VRRGRGRTVLLLFEGRSTLRQVPALRMLADSDSLATIVENSKVA
jgi:hypothetical protein